MKPLVIIPARGGSKGINQKNIKVLGGIPLIQHTILAAQNCFTNEQICITTDDIEIQIASQINGLTIPFTRPAALATDTAGTYEVLLHALAYFEDNYYQPDTIVLLQPTSPFRTADHIKEALSLYTNNLEMVVSVRESKQNPYYNLFEEDSYGFLKKSKSSNFTRRQDVSPVYEYNGAIYVINANALKEKPISEFTKIKKYVMDEIVSHDIDTELDWSLAEIIYNKINLK